MKMRRFARECNFHEACKDYLERGAVWPFFDAYSLPAVRTLDNFIIFCLKVILSFCRKLRVGDA
ncbi:MAG: hypothetical protein DMG37_15895 [Acidobacteria bacterium]|nr:MAG: hypothetical protein DMG37_15895 [Acidobacteriota bacterium]